MNISPTEIFPATQRGTIDGWSSGYAAAITYGGDKPAPYLITNIPTGTVANFPICISTAAWNKLPPDIQSIMDSAVPDHIDAFTRIYDTEKNGAALETMKAGGVQMVEFSDADVQKVKEAASGIWDEWANEQEANGLPGKEVLAAYLKAYEKYEALSPK